MRARNFVILIVLLTISAVALLSVYRPHIYLHRGRGIQFTAEETTPMPHKIHSFSISTNGFESSHHVYQKVNVLKVWPISNAPPSIPDEARVQDQ